MNARKIGEQRDGLKFDGYSYHDISGPEDGQVAWVVIEDWIDSEGDVQDTELIADFRQENDARRLCERLNAEAHRTR
jgi:hypothetical protein